jgi:hypothetical protein
MNWKFWKRNEPTEKPREISAPMPQPIDAIAFGDMADAFKRSDFWTWFLSLQAGLVEDALLAGSEHPESAQAVAYHSARAEAFMSLTKTISEAIRQRDGIIAARRNNFRPHGAGMETQKGR